jgi:hypothetical protein
MVPSSSHQTWLFYSPLAQQAALLKDDLLDPVDLLLDDPALVDLVRQCLAKRSPRSTRTGRRGLAPDRLLRCCVMKHLKGWSFRDLERELRSNLVYRRFTGAADKAANLVGCKSPHHQLPGRVVSISDACGGNEACSART